MSCISLNTLRRLSGVWHLCAGFQELINGSAVEGMGQGLWKRPLERQGGWKKKG